MLQCTIHPLHEGEGPGVKKEEGRVSAKTDLDLTSISIAATITDIAVYFPSCFIDSMFITVANNEDFGKNPKSFFFFTCLGHKEHRKNSETRFCSISIFEAPGKGASATEHKQKVVRTKKMQTA